MYYILPYKFKNVQHLQPQTPSKRHQQTTQTFKPSLRKPGKSVYFLNVGTVATDLR